MPQRVPQHASLPFEALLLLMEGQPGAALRPVVWTERTVVELWGKLKWTIKHTQTSWMKCSISCVIGVWLSFVSHQLHRRQWYKWWCKAYLCCRIYRSLRMQILTDLSHFDFLFLHPSRITCIHRCLSDISFVRRGYQIHRTSAPKYVYRFS